MESDSADCRCCRVGSSKQEPLLDPLPIQACSVSKEGQQLASRIPLQSICATKPATLFPNVFFQDCSNCAGHVQERARKKLL